MPDRFLRIEPDCAERGRPPVVRLDDIVSVHLAPDGDGVVLRAMTRQGLPIRIARFDLGEEFEALHALRTLADLIQDESVVLYRVARFSLQQTAWPSKEAMHEALEREETKAQKRGEAESHA